MAKITVWDEEMAQRELSQRLRNSADQRRYDEIHWERNERTIFSHTVGGVLRPRVGVAASDLDIAIDDVDSSSSDVAITYAFKNFRFIHAQLSANPPSVIPRPTSSDQEDRRKADAADRLVRHAIRTYKMQERIDQASLQTLLYGTGFLKTRWDGEIGDILRVDEDGTLEMEGDISISVPHTWNIFIDPDANSVDEIRYVFERMYIPFDEALFRFGEEKRDILEAHRIQSGEDVVDRGSIMSTFAKQAILQKKYDVVEVYEYWERGLPTNGYLGRYCICTQDGKLISSLSANPFAFSVPGKGKIPPTAQLPYHVFTDVDVPNRVWGRSFVEYVSGLQDTLNRLDSVTLDNIQAHGVMRVILPEGCEIADDSMTNTPWEVVKMTGTQPPHYMQAPPSLPLVDALRAQIKVGIDDMAGVNEFMFGQQSRETSGFSMQYATNQGNMIRRRLFNKYVLFVESIYRSYLNLVRKHWKIPRTIMVLGKEKALEAIDIRGMDIDGGFDIVVEYGAAFSLDPMTRKEEIMALQPLFEKAGVPVRVSLKMMKLSELEGLYDIMQLAEDRQREIFEEMIATGKYISPEEFQDHENMMAYALQYVMTSEFKYLEPRLKQLIRQHIRDRSRGRSRRNGGKLSRSRLRPRRPRRRGKGAGCRSRTRD